MPRAEFRAQAASSNRTVASQHSSSPPRLGRPPQAGGRPELLFVWVEPVATLFTHLCQKPQAPWYAVEDTEPTVSTEVAGAVCSRPSFHLASAPYYWAFCSLRKPEATDPLLEPWYGQPRRAALRLGQGTRKERTKLGHRDPLELDLRL